MGWLIDPDEKTVLVYRPKQEIEVFDEVDLVLLVPGFAIGLKLTVGELFGLLVL